MLYTDCGSAQEARVNLTLVFYRVLCSVPSGLFRYEDDVGEGVEGRINGEEKVEVGLAYDTCHEVVWSEPCTQPHRAMYDDVLL